MYSKHLGTQIWPSKMRSAVLNGRRLFWEREKQVLMTVSFQVLFHIVGLQPMSSKSTRKVKSAIKEWVMFEDDMIGDGATEDQNHRLGPTTELKWPVLFIIFMLLVIFFKFCRSAGMVPELVKLGACFLFSSISCSRNNRRLWPHLKEPPQGSECMQIQQQKRKHATSWSI